MTRRFEHIWESDEIAPTLARGVLVPLSLAFRGAARLRAAAYDRGYAEVARAPIPVVSVGNLRVGGSGKTPLVLWLAGRLTAAGRHPAIVTRGYGVGRAERATVLVSSSRSRELDSTRAGSSASIVVLEDAQPPPRGLADEAVLLALRTGSPLVVSPDRLRGCEVAVRLGADVVLLDDGFQHRRLERNLDIVLTSASDARARFLPAGPLREGLRALARADVVVATDEGAPVYGRPCFRARQRATGIVRTLGRDVPIEPVEALRGRHVVAVAGIARPERFLALLEAAGAKLACVPYLLRDHHAYDAADVAALARSATGERLVVTTEKDLVKLAGIFETTIDLAAIRIDLDVDDGDALVERVLVAAGSLDASRGGPHHPSLSPAGAGTGT